MRGVPLSPHKYLEDPKTGCWVWQRSCVPEGYGKLSYEGKFYRAHRWYWEQENGPIPDELVIDHLCRNPKCVNPEHLEPVPQAVNVRRRINRKLDAQKVSEIRSLCEQGWDRNDIAEAYGVSYGYVSHLYCGLFWKDGAE